MTQWIDTLPYPGPVVSPETSRYTYDFQLVDWQLVSQYFIKKYQLVVVYQIPASLDPKFIVGSFFRTTESGDILGVVMDIEVLVDPWMTRYHVQVNT